MSRWTKKNYRILLSNGDRRRAHGESNGLFALDSTLTLTHLESGGKVAQFVEAEAAKRVGDYLKDHYAEEFTALGKAIPKNPTAEEYNLLPEAIALNRKLKADVYLNARLAEFAIKVESL
jgi:hypothetical protein